MKNFRLKKAFTIIEVMLVLSISGLMLVTMLVGWNTNIEKQRYNDSVNTFKSDIQGVFSDVENQTNNKDGQKVDCVVNSTGSISVRPVRSGGGDSAGATRCVILGKLMVFGDLVLSGTGASVGNQEVTVYNVIGRDIDVSRDCVDSGRRVACKNSIEALRATGFVVDAGANKITEPQKISLQWDSQFSNITDNRASRGHPFSGAAPVSGMEVKGAKYTPDNINGVMILRSPMDNSLVSFGISSISAGDGKRAFNESSSITQLRNVDTLQEERIITDQKTVNLCIRPGHNERSWLGGFNPFGGRNKVLRIGPSAAAVEVAPLDGPNGSSCGSGNGFEDVIINGVKL